MGLLMAVNGKGYLIPALMLGYILAAVTVFAMGSRIWRSMGLTVGAAKRQMWWGLFLRLTMLFVVLTVAIRLSVDVFAATVMGFALCYALAIVTLAREALTDSREIYPKEA